MTDAEGRTFEDSVDDGIVLFSDDSVAIPNASISTALMTELLPSEGWGFIDELGSDAYEITREPWTGLSSKFGVSP